MNLLESIEEPKNFEIKIKETGDKLKGEILVTSVINRDCYIFDEPTKVTKTTKGKVYMVYMSLCNVSKTPYHVVRFMINNSVKQDEKDKEKINLILKSDSYGDIDFKPVYMRENEYIEVLFTLSAEYDTKPILTCKIGGYTGEIKYLDQY